MANNTGEIDLIAGQEAFNQIDKLIKQVAIADEEMVKLSQSALAVNKNLAGIVSPKGLNDQIIANQKLANDFETLKQKYTSLSDTIAKKAEQSRLAEIKLQKQRENAFDSFDKNVQKEEAAIKKAEGNYQRLQNSVNLMTKAYNDLAVRKELGGTLTDKEEKQLASLQKRISDYNAVLLKVDSTIGKNQRNVGNYASGYNALGNSINQLTREAPAFANSWNTGFMALSNNIPIFFDAIKQTKDEIIAMRAQGKEVPGLFKQLASSFLGWGTALSLGVTLLTLYGGKIVETISGSKEKKEALEKEKKALESKTKAEEHDREVISSKQSDEIARSQILLETAKNVSNSYVQRTKAVKELQERYPDYLGSLSKEQILAGDTEKAELALNDALIKRGIALGAQQQIQEVINKQLKDEKKFVDDLHNIEIERLKLGAQNIDPFTKDESQRKRLEERNNQLTHLFYAEKSINEQHDIRKKKNEDDLKFYIEQYNINSKFLDVVRETNKEKTKKPPKEDTTPKVQALETSLKSVGTIISQINEEISRLTTEQIVSDESALPAINFQLEQLVKLKQQIKGMPEVDLKIINTTVKSKEAIKQLSEEMKNYLNSFTAEFFDKSGFSESFKILNGEIEGFGENWQVTAVSIMESAQEMFNFISQNSQANFEAERERLDAQKEISIAYAGDSAVARDKIEKDYEQKRKEIANREAKAKKDLVMFEIAIDTAQAVVAALPNIPLSIAVGALGGIQLAMVASREIPKYFKGTQNHIGGAMLVNDGAGSDFRETIVTPDNKIYQPTERNVLMNAPKGTKVFTHSQWKQELDNMIFSNDINWANQNNSGINKNDLANLGSGIVSAIQNKKEFSLSVDKKGFNTSIIEGNTRRTILNNEINSKGIFT